MDRKFRGRLTNAKSYKHLKNGIKITTKFKNISNIRPERLETPFKRRGMQNYVGLYRMYAFTSSVARVFVPQTLENLQSNIESGPFRRGRAGD